MERRRLDKIYETDVLEIHVILGFGLLSFSCSVWRCLGGIKKDFVALSLAGTEPPKA